MINLEILKIYEDKIGRFVEKGSCSHRLWPIFDAWMAGGLMFSYDCITDGKTIYARNYGQKKPIKIGDTINGKKLVYDYTYHFYASKGLNSAFAVGYLKKRITERIGADVRKELISLCSSYYKFSQFGSAYIEPSFSPCTRRHKKEHCSGYKINIHGKSFCKSDLLKKKVGEILYIKDMDKIFNIMDRYPAIVRPSEIRYN